MTAAAAKMPAPDAGENAMNDEAAPRRRLGRGLAALIGDYDLSVPPPAAGAAAAVPAGARVVPIDLIRRNPRNPRKVFREAELADLAASIRRSGVIQPLLVRTAPGDANAYELIAGERRWRAAQTVGVHEVPVLVKDVSDREALEIAIIENVQRQDLNPLEEAEGYERLIADFSYTQQDLAQVIGKSRSHVANTLRLLALPAVVKDYLDEGALTAGHARAIAAAPDPAALARKIVAGSLSVRAAEALAQGASTRPPRVRAGKDADTRALEGELTRALGLVVEVAARPGGGGELRIRYRTPEQLDEVIRRLRG